MKASLGVKAQLGVLVPRELYDRLVTFSDSTGINRGRVVTEALTLYFATLDGKPPATVDPMALYREAMRLKRKASARKDVDE